MPYLTCTRCSKEFEDKRSAEEKLLLYLWGETLCPTCSQFPDAATCAYCGNDAPEPVYYMDDPYHPKCLGEMRE